MFSGCAGFFQFTVLLLSCVNTVIVFVTHSPQLRAPRARAALAAPVIAASPIGARGASGASGASNASASSTTCSTSGASSAGGASTSTKVQRERRRALA